MRKLEKITLLKILVIQYLSLISLALHVITIPATWKTIISLPAFLIIPWLTGRFFLFLLHKAKILEDLCYNGVFNIIFEWFLGNLFTSITCVLFHLLKLNLLVKNLHIITASLVIISLLLMDKRSYSRTLKIPPQDMFFCGSIAIVPALIARWNVPFGYPAMGWMIPTIIHQPALRVIKYGYVDLRGLRVPEYLLTALISALYDIDPMQLNWGLPFILAPVYSIGVYLLSYRLFRSRFLSIIAAIFAPYLNVGTTPETIFFGTFLENPRSNTILYALFPFMLTFLDGLATVQEVTFEKMFLAIVLIFAPMLFVYVVAESNYLKPEKFGLHPSFRPFFIRPITILGVLVCSLLLYKLLRKRENEVWGIIPAPLLLISLSFYMFHRDEAIIFCFIAVLYMLFRKISLEAKRLSINFRIRHRMLFKISSSLHELLFLIILSSATTYIALWFCGSIDFLQIKFSSILWPETLRQPPISNLVIKRHDFLNANNPIVITVLVAGLLIALLKRRPNYLLVSTMFLVTFTIYVLPDYWLYRAYKEFSPFMAIVLAIPFDYVRRSWIAKSFSRSEGNKLREYALAILASILIIMFLLFSLIPPLISRFSYTPKGSSYYSLITDYEYSTANWLRANLPDNVRLISDYRTIVLLTPLANKIWITEKGMSVYSLSQQDKELLSYVKRRILMNPDPVEAWKATIELEGNISWSERYFLERIGKEPGPLVIVFSCRTQEWLARKGLSDVTFPQQDAIIEDAHFKKFLNGKFFKLVYNIDDKIYVFIPMLTNSSTSRHGI